MVCLLSVCDKIAYRYLGTGLWDKTLQVVWTGTQKDRRCWVVVKGSVVALLFCLKELERKRGITHSFTVLCRKMCMMWRMRSDPVLLILPVTLNYVYWETRKSKESFLHFFRSLKVEKKNICNIISKRDFLAFLLLCWKVLRTEAKNCFRFLPLI